MSQPETTEFWKGKFGSEYHLRQETTVQAREVMYRLALPATFDTLLEFGAGTGDNLRAIANINPEAKLFATEIHEKARESIPTGVSVYRQPIQGFHTPLRFDVTMTRGLLIHVPPEDLPAAYQALYEHSKRWIIIAEYYSPTPREIAYRGEKGKLWARDFAGEMMDKYPDLQLENYQFIYHRDPMAPQDDVTFFVMEKV